MKKYNLSSLAILVIFSAVLSFALPPLTVSAAALTDSQRIDQFAIDDQEPIDYALFSEMVQSLPTYYNKAFKTTVPVTCFINPANIEDSRLYYQNWSSIYGLAPTAGQVVMPQPYTSHRGQDWNSTVYQEPLYAIHDGTVTRAAYDSSYGNRIDYTFGNWTIYYAHLSQMNVQVGATVTNGQKIGNVGATGNVTGEHVHIGLLYKGKLVDPHPFVTGVWDFDTKAAELEGTTITYYVQVGAFANRTYADNYAAEVRSKGFDAFVRVYSGETYPYRVQCGAFTIYNNAVNYKNQLIAAGIDAFITTN